MNRELLQEAPPLPFMLRGWRAGFLAVFLIALLARVPFFATHHIQEDAYITFRSAFHLADAGDYFSISESMIPASPASSTDR